MSEHSSPEQLAKSAAMDGKRALLSEELARLQEVFRDRPAKLGEVIEVVQGRGYNLVLLLLCLPFLTPISLPLLSTVMGTAVALIGFRLALGQKPHLPERYLQHELPAKFFPRLLGATRKLVKLLEYGLRPRLRFLHEKTLFRRLGGLLIAVSGLMLLLPIPVPFSNFFPAVAAFTISASELENDGLVFLAGCFCFLLAVTFFCLLAFGGSEAISYVYNRFKPI